MSKLPIIGITMGDINSIATEVIIKTLADSRINEYCVPVIYGSPKVISYWKKKRVLKSQGPASCRMLKLLKPHGLPE